MARIGPRAVLPAKSVVEGQRNGVRWNTSESKQRSGNVVGELNKKPKQRNDLKRCAGKHSPLCATLWTAQIEKKALDFQAFTQDPSKIARAPALALPSLTPWNKAGRTPFLVICSSSVWVIVGRPQCW